jgi:hypothetical protein
MSDEQSRLIYNCSKSKEGKELLKFIEGHAVKRLRGSSEEIQLQAGKLNLWLDICDEIELGSSD